MTHVFDIDPELSATMAGVCGPFCDGEGLRQAEAAGWSPELWSTLTELGLTGVGVGEESGGSGGSNFHVVCCKLGLRHSQRHDCGGCGVHVASSLIPTKIWVGRLISHEFISCDSGKCLDNTCLRRGYGDVVTSGRQQDMSAECAASVLPRERSLLLLPRVVSVKLWRCILDGMIRIDSDVSDVVGCISTYSGHHKK